MIWTAILSDHFPLPWNLSTADEIVTILSDHFPLPWNLSTADEIVTTFITNFSVFNPCSIISLTGQINKLHLPLWTPFDGEKTKGIWSFVYNLIRLILACVQDSLIIQKSYNTSLMIQILSCVPALKSASVTGWGST
jgi:hypothetical protein